MPLNNDPPPNNPVHIITGERRPKVLVNGIDVGNWVSDVVININPENLMTATVTFIDPKINGGTSTPKWTGRK